MNTSSLTIPRRLSAALCMDCPAPFPITGLCAVSSQGNLQCINHTVFS